jgi:hypothetical protein
MAMATPNLVGRVGEIAAEPLTDPGDKPAYDPAMRRAVTCKEVR